MLSVLSIIFVIIKVIIAFSVLIMIHEFGHFIVAKRSGVWVEEFGLGIPPRIFGKKIGDTLYSLNWLPIGGFVKLHGETSSEEVKYPKKAFTDKSKPIKIAITIAGIVMNFVLAIICFSVIFGVTGIPTTQDKNIVIVDVNANSPASAAKLAKGDIVKKINGKSIETDDDIKNIVSQNLGKEILFEVTHNNETLDFKVTPRTKAPEGEGSLGIVFTDVVTQNYYQPPLWQRPFLSVWYGIKQTYDVTKAVIGGLGGAAKSVSQGQTPKGVSGPVGIIAIAKRFAEADLLSLISFVGLISVNLAIINLIPFPPLDGSRVALVIAEWLTKKKMTPKLEERVYLIGFLVLIGLTILITAHDIPALIKAGSLDKYADQIISGK